MTDLQRGTLRVVRNRPNCDRAVIFLHGFSGNTDNTWGRFPTLLGTLVHDWDIYTLEYATSLRPDFVGGWKADPELPLLAIRLTTEAAVEPLRRYRSLALVAHSMGGLIVQRALLDDPTLASRAEAVVMFGSPSAGIRKVSRLVFWKRQVRNMAQDSDFIRTLRAEWTERFEALTDFELLVVAGDQDHFVPSETSFFRFLATLGGWWMAATSQW